MRMINKKVSYTANRSRVSLRGRPCELWKFSSCVVCSPCKICFSHCVRARAHVGDAGPIPLGRGRAVTP